MTYHSNSRRPLVASASGREARIKIWGANHQLINQSINQNAFILRLCRERIVIFSQTRKDVGAECRHDMRPSVQLPTVTGIDSKMGHHTMVRPREFAVGASGLPEPP